MKLPMVMNMEFFLNSSRSTTFSIILLLWVLGGCTYAGTKEKKEDKEILSEYVEEGGKNKEIPVPAPPPDLCKERYVKSVLASQKKSADKYKKMAEEEREEADKTELKLKKQKEEEEKKIKIFRSRMAKNLLGHGISVDQIVTATGLIEEEVGDIRDGAASKKNSPAESKEVKVPVGVEEEKASED